MTSREPASRDRVYAIELSTPIPKYGHVFLSGDPPLVPPSTGGRSPSPLTGRVGVGSLHSSPYL